jgi:hypothetical protein
LLIKHEIYLAKILTKPNSFSYLWITLWCSYEKINFISNIFDNI